MWPWKLLTCHLAHSPLRRYSLFLKGFSRRIKIWSFLLAQKSISHSVEYCNSVASSDHRKYLFIYLITNYLYFSWDNCFPDMSPTNINTFTGHACQSLLTSCDAVSAPLYFGEVKPSHALECCGSWELASFPPGIHQTHGHTQSHSCIPPSEDCCFAWGCEKLETTKGLCTQACHIPHLTASFSLSFLSFSHTADSLHVSLSGPKLI